MVRRTAIVATGTATGRDHCPQCATTRQNIHADPLARRITQWADVVLTVTDCDHAPADDATPAAPARFEPPNSLVVDACPFCGKTHRHGALAPAPGSSPSPDAYGYRAAHCHPATGPTAYRLVPAQVDE